MMAGTGRIDDRFVPALPSLLLPPEIARAVWPSSSRHGVIWAINEKNVEIRALRSIPDFMADTSISVDTSLILLNFSRPGSLSGGSALGAWAAWAFSSQGANCGILRKPYSGRRAISGIQFVEQRVRPTGPRRIRDGIVDRLDEGGFVPVECVEFKGIQTRKP
jgi:hypothetical protein